MLVWSVFLSLTALHIYANIRAMRSLQLTSLNRPRVDVLLAEYLKSRQVGPGTLFLKYSNSMALYGLVRKHIWCIWAWLQLAHEPGCLVS